VRESLFQLPEHPPKGAPLASESRRGSGEGSIEGTLGRVRGGLLDRSDSRGELNPNPPEKIGGFIFVLDKGTVKLRQRSAAPVKW
jgi:hypothetical protein